jgi:hypothetical protein
MAERAVAQKHISSCGVLTQPVKLRRQQRI